LLIERWRSELLQMVGGLISYILLGPFFVAGLAGVGIAIFLATRRVYAEMKSFEERNACELLVKLRPTGRLWGASVYLRELAL
jgi:hypothetical protein